MGPLDNMATIDIMAFTKSADICDLWTAKATVIFPVPRCELPLTAAGKIMQQCML